MREPETIRERMRLENIQGSDCRKVTCKNPACEWPIPIVRGMQKRGHDVRCMACGHWTRDPQAQPPPIPKARPMPEGPKIEQPEMRSNTFEVKCRCGKVHVITRHTNRDNKILCSCGLLSSEKRMLAQAGDDAKELYVSTMSPLS